MIEAPTLEQLYGRMVAAETAWLAFPAKIPTNQSPASNALCDYLSAKADYDRALIAAARTRQGEY